MAGSPSMNNRPHPAKHELMEKPDCAGGVMYQAPAGRSAAPSKGSPASGSMIDGPYGGKKRQG